MPDAHAIRCQIASDLLGIAQKHPDVAATAIGGSVAWGFCDDASDLEVVLYWRRPVNEATRTAVLATPHGAHTSRQITRTEPWMGVENLSLRGFSVDVIHLDLDGTRDRITQTLSKPDVQTAAQAFCANLRTVRPLSGAAHLDPLREAAAYTDDYAISVVRHFAWLAPIGGAATLAHRNARLALTLRQAETIDRLTVLWCALNRTWYPGRKWIERVLAALPILPRDALVRMGAGGVRDVEALGAETYELLAAHLPTAPIEAARARFHQRLRRQWSPEALEAWRRGETPDFPPAYKLT